MDWRLRLAAGLSEASPEPADATLIGAPTNGKTPQMNISSSEVA